MLRRSSAAGILACFVSVLCVALAASTARQVQYHANSRELSFLVPKPGSGEVLFTFPADVTIAEIQNSPMMSSLGTDCELVVARNADSTMQLRAILPSSPAMQVVCAASGLGAAQLSVVPVSTWRDRLTDQDRLRVREAQQKRADWVAQGNETEYAFHLIDYMYNTIDALLAWFTTFVVSHWGPLHPFPVFNVTSAQAFDSSLNLGADYATAVRSLAAGAATARSESLPESVARLLEHKPEEDTGLYHMQTGRVLTPAQSKLLADVGAAEASTPAALGARAEAGNAGTLLDDEEVRISITADWGSGTIEADAVSALMAEESNPHYTIHVGDVYYVGSPQETDTNCLGVKPKTASKGVLFRPGSRGSFAYQGNHEMYSRGFGYFDKWLPRIGVIDAETGKARGQKASFGSLDNKHWRVIGLDTGYNTYSPLIDNKNNTQPQQVMDWLQHVARINDPSDTRGIIIISHHQYRSAFERGYYPTPEQLAKLVPANRTLLWLWGHEHRVSWYDKGSAGGVKLEVYGRCLGVGGFPVDHEPIPEGARAAGLVAYDNRVYDVEAGFFNATVGFNGFTTLKLNGRNVTLEYRSLLRESDKGNGDSRPRFDRSSLLVREVFSVNDKGSVMIRSFDVVDKDVTVVDQQMGARGDVGAGTSDADKRAHKADAEAADSLRMLREASREEAMAELGPVAELEALATRAEEIFLSKAREYTLARIKFGKK